MSLDEIEMNTLDSVDLETTADALPAEEPTHTVAVTEDAVDVAQGTLSSEVESEAPDYDRESTADLAAVIAGAVAATMRRETQEVVSVPASESAMQDPPQPEGMPSEIPFQEEEFAPSRKEIPQDPVVNSSSHPGADIGRRIPRSYVKPDYVKLLLGTFTDIRSRQKQDLPENNTSLKAAEKRQALLVRLGELFAPLRCVILLLMAMSLVGRKYSWMLLGLLGGESGVKIAAALTATAMLLAWRSVFDAVKDIYYARPSYETLLLLTTILSMAETALLQDPQTLMPILAIGWCMVGSADTMLARGKLRSLQTVINGKTRRGVRVAKARWDGQDCIGKASASTAGFVRHLEYRDTWHASWSLYGPALCIATLIAAAYLTARTSGNYLHIVVTILTMAMPVVGVSCCAKSFRMLSGILGKHGAISGWYGLRLLSGKKTLLIYDQDFFPTGTIRHKGVKVYGRQTPELLVSLGASLARHADNGLDEPFTKLLQETGGQLLPVSHFQTMEGGMSGRINGFYVSVGTYHFMQLMGMMPPQGETRNGLFIGISNEVAGVFAIKYKIKTGAGSAFQRLVRERRLNLVAATRNLCVNPAFASQWFHVDVGALTCPKAETRSALAKPSLVSRGVTCGYQITEGIVPYSRLVAGSRRCYRTGLLFTVLSIILSAYMALTAMQEILMGGELPGGETLLVIQIALWLLIELAIRLAIR